MRISRSRQHIDLTLSEPETRFLGRILQTIVTHYHIPPAELDSKTAAVWYSTRGCAAAKMSPEETRDWIQNIHQFKGNRTALLERCLKHLQAPRKNRGARLTLSLAEAPDLIAALNDHRLWLAAQHDIGESEMTRRSFEDWLHLQPGQSQALAEIHLLAQIIELLLHHIAPDAADWPNATDWSPE